jgi:hypothetical protein
VTRGRAKLVDGWRQKNGPFKKIEERRILGASFSDQWFESTRTVN